MNDCNYYYTVNNHKDSMKNKTITTTITTTQTKHNHNNNDDDHGIMVLEQASN